MDRTTSIVLIVAGIIAMLGAALNWRIVTHSGKLFNLLLGDKAARVIYFSLGVVLFAKGVEVLIGAHWLPF